MLTQEDPDEGLQKQKKTVLSYVAEAAKYVLAKAIVHRQTFMFFVNLVSAIYKLIKFMSHHF